MPKLLYPLFNTDLQLQDYIPTPQGCGVYRGEIELSSIGRIFLNDLGTLSFRTTFPAYNEVFQGGGLPDGCK